MSTDTGRAGCRRVERKERFDVKNTHTHTLLAVALARTAVVVALRSRRRRFRATLLFRRRPKKPCACLFATCACPFRRSGGETKKKGTFLRPP